MRIIKLNTIILLMLMMACSFLSCKKDKEGKEEASLIALWKVQSEKSQNYYDGQLRTEKTTDVSNRQIYFHFLARGTMQMVGFDTDVDFNYTYNSSTKEVALTPNEIFGEKVFMRIKELTDTKLVLIMEVWETPDGKSKYINEYTCKEEIDLSK